jgi:hypothetical protein
MHFLDLDAGNARETRNVRIPPRDLAATGGRAAQGVSARIRPGLGLRRAHGRPVRPANAMPIRKCIPTRPSRLRSVSFGR